MRNRFGDTVLLSGLEAMYKISVDVRSLCTLYPHDGSKMNLRSELTWLTLVDNDEFGGIAYR